MTKTIVLYPFKISRTQIMHLVDTRAEKVPAFSGHGNHCSPARTGVFYYSDGCTSVCLGAHSAVAQCYSLPPALCVCTLAKLGQAWPSMFLLG